MLEICREEDFEFAKGDYVSYSCLDDTISIDDGLLIVSIDRTELDTLIDELVAMREYLNTQGE